MRPRALGRRVLSRLHLRGRNPGLGHRRYVGGHWEEVGQLQFDFLVARGLRPEHVLLDIACGSLRGGVHCIPYLDPGNYLGIDKEELLIRRGLEQELSREVRAAKRPEFVISDSFEFERFSKVPDRSLAVSLFTHLIVADMERCLTKLRAFVRPGHELYVTFWPGDSADNPPESHSHKRFLYSGDELAELGRRCGWQANYIGQWGHPRGQEMMRFVAPPG